MADHMPEMNLMVYRTLGGGDGRGLRLADSGWRKPTLSEPRKTPNCHREKNGDDWGRGRTDGESR